MDPESDATPVDTLPDPAADTWIGRTVAGRFRLVGELGAGGIAVVFRAEDVELSRDVAVKILQETGHGRAELRARFEREAKVLAALSHPNIVSLVDYGVEDGRAFLVMELLRGRTLGELLDEVDIVTPDRALHILRQVCRALAYAHGEGLLHRDLKPDNIFLQALPDTPDHVRLLDFGFAKFVSQGRDGGPALTQAGTVFGTPRYMAPEQLTGSSVDARVDLYSVAVILYEMLCGRRPFEGEVREVLKAKVVEDPPTLSAVAPDFDVSPELDGFFARALAIRREERFADAPAFLEALEALPRPWLKPKASSKAAPEGSNLRWIVPLALGAGLMFVASAALGVAWLLWPREASTDEALPAPAVPLVAPPVEEEEPASIPDPWDAEGPRAPSVEVVREAVVTGAAIDSESLRALREHARAQPGDAHAQLLLGHVFTQRGMRAMAVAAYERAVAIDRDARGDPRMIVDLLGMVARSDADSGAGRIIRAVYGVEALDVIDAALDREGLDARTVRRLEGLRDAITAP